MAEVGLVSGRDAVPERQRVPVFFVSRGWRDRREEGEKRKQEKGNASSASLSVCLHIFLLRDMAGAVRDMLAEIDGNPAFFLRNREMHALL